MRRLLVLVIAMALGLVLSPISTSTAQAIPPDAPCTVGSYSTHARLQMEVRDISAWEVRNAVTVSCHQNRVTKQGNGTFKYHATYVVVVMDWRRNVVTVHFASGGGGGGWSIPQ